MGPAKKGWLLLALVLSAGCSEALETGYMPRRLKATESERRAFYAPQYTPESQKKTQALAPDLGLRR